MNIKKIGIWGGAGIALFLLITVMVYFLFPYLNSEKARITEENFGQEQAENSYNPNDYSLQAVDSLKRQVSSLQTQVGSLKDSIALKQQLIDSLMMDEQEAPAPTPAAQTISEQIAEPPSGMPKIDEATKPLLSLDQEALAPIVDLLNDEQLISLYAEGTGRQRKKLLQCLKPQKAARILQKVM